MTTSYAIALGSNRRTRHGSPRATLDAAVAVLGELGGLAAVSPVIASAPIGPSRRCFANAVVILESRDAPPALLDRLKEVERDFGRRRGRRWGERALDLDIVLWSAGYWAGPGLTVPHPEFRARDFVLDPLAMVAPDWRDPVTGLAVRHLRHRLMRG